jgi:hypothetical protein
LQILLTASRPSARFDGRTERSFRRHGRSSKIDGKQGLTRDAVRGSGEKRRRKRDRRFADFYETLSIRASIIGVGGSIALLAWVAARSVFSI